MEKPARNPRTIAKEKQRGKLAAEPKVDPYTGSPHPRDAVRGTPKPDEGPGGTPSVGAPDKAAAS